MAFAYSKDGKYLGPASTIFWMHETDLAVEKFDRSRAGGGRVPYLCSFLQHGEIYEPDKVVKDIFKILRHSKNLNKEVVWVSRNMKKTLSGQKGWIAIVEA